MTAVRVALLGPLEVTVGGVPMPLGGPGRRAVLTALSLALGSTVGVPELLEAIWDDRPPITATTKLQGHVCALRQSIRRLGGRDAAEAVQTRIPGYALCPPRAGTDLLRFDDCTRRARETAHPRDRAALLGAALGLWRGPFGGADLPSTWMTGAADALHERRWRATEDLAEAELTLGDHDTVIDRMERVVSRAPYREKAWEHLMAAHLRRGDPVSALRVHDRVRRTLAADLGLPPGRRIARLAEAALAAR